MTQTTTQWVDLSYITIRFQVHENTVYRAIHANRLPAYRVGRRFRFRIEDVEAWAQPYAPASGEWPDRGHTGDEPTGPIETGEAALHQTGGK